MYRLPWYILTATVAVALVASAILLMIPTRFRLANASVYDFEDESNAAINVTWSNLLCKTPRPHLEMEDGDINDYWDLPTTVRLSPRMHEIGRCGVAALEKNEQRRDSVDQSICHCFNVWWVPVMAVVASAVGMFMIGQSVTGMVINRTGSFRRQEIDKLDGVEFVRNLAALVAIFAYVLGSNSDMTYTKYGNLHPTDYIDVMPTTWRVAVSLFTFGNVTQTIAYFIGRSCRSCRRRPKDRSNRNKRESSSKKEVRECDSPPRDQRRCETAGSKGDTPKPVYRILWKIDETSLDPLSATVVDGKPELEPVHSGSPVDIEMIKSFSAESESTSKPIEMEKVESEDAKDAEKKMPEVMLDDEIGETKKCCL